MNNQNPYRASKPSAEILRYSDTSLVFSITLTFVTSTVSYEYFLPSIKTAIKMGKRGRIEKGCYLQKIIKKEKFSTFVQHYTYNNYQDTIVHKILLVLE